jgi:basic membrane protein A and related proteins
MEIPARPPVFARLKARHLFTRDSFHENRPSLRCAASLGALSLAAALIGASPVHAEDKAAILLPGSANDQSWNALGYSILKSLEPHGFKTAYSENVADADEAEALRDYANQGYGVVMGHSGRFVSAMEQVAPDFPKTQFIAVSGNEGKPPNVRSTGTTRNLAVSWAFLPPA